MKLTKADINSVKLGKDFSEDPPMYLVRHDECLDIGQFYTTEDAELVFAPTAGDLYRFIPNEIWEIVDED
jgi:hypothetical protein